MLNSEWPKLGELAGVKIVLGVCGSIAVYKAAYLVRELCAIGACVRVVMTEGALAFMQPMTFQALSGEAVACDLLNEQAERAMGHIELARWADYLLIAPASASFIAKIAHGIADDLLSTLYLATVAPVIICPAMNQNMWAHPATIANCALLRDRGALFCGPDIGSQACGDMGLGRMVEPETIASTLRLYPVHNIFQGKEFLITAGPTREAIDPVRYLSNYSSGKMGYALAQAAQIAGARVTVISGPCALLAPFGVRRIQVNSAEDMLTAVMAHLKPNSVFIGAAAVADYRIIAPKTEKLKRQDNESMTLVLQKNPDILAAVVASKQAAMVIGFAAETHDVLTHAAAKLAAKQVDMIIANQVGEGLGFETEDNQVTILTAKQQIPLAFASKITLAGQIMLMIAQTLENDVRSCYEPGYSN
ncbi:MAG: bifunctional phosphopantothenoylcysteine decarboxylase/phosphopantothenate--cysteine ligase CoaBC [Legionellales bacterium]|nr:bifunctional phosphopantothenoylcysteine decarboxylase/phosphopantothenate--cysteine ligase CoaBC [Legionellales bacterium]